MNRDQRTFNAFVDETRENPADAWKWRGTRSKARNKAIAMHAQLTAGYIIPMFMAQNEFDEEDEGFSDAMEDCVQWLADNSSYKPSFLAVSMGMLVNPVTYMGAEWCEVFQTIKERSENGSITRKEVLDEVLSGFHAPVWSADQVLITNPYEQNIQRQRGVIKRRWVDYSEAKAKYENHENWVYVKPGYKVVFNEDDGLFYDIKDDDHKFLVEEAIVQYRREDTEVSFVGGIYMGDDDVSANPIKHRDNRNTPKYNIVPFGYQRVNEHFFYFKSLMNAQYWDNQLLDAQYELGMNRAFLDVAMPVAVSGSDKIDSDVIFPSSVVTSEDPDMKITPILPRADLGNFFGAMQTVEASLDESSISATAGGQLPDADQKATAIVYAQKNAQTLLEGVGKTLAESVVQYGNLMADIVINHLSVPQVEDILSGGANLKYRTLMLKERAMSGRSMDKEIRFDESLLGEDLTEEEQDSKSLELLSEVGYPNNSKHIYRHNPELFSKMRYFTRVEPQRMFPKNEEYQQAVASQLYSELRADPFVDGKALLRKVLYSYYRGDSDELIAKGQPAVNPMDVMGGGKPPVPAVSRQQIQRETAVV